MKKSIGYPKTKALLEWFGENPRQISAHKPLNPLWFHRFTNDRKYDPSTGLLDTERAAYKNPFAGPVIYPVFIWEKYRNLH